ncbi:thiamine diphosphokinase [Limibaculum sp. M0105]|uniref:Thiamine diphosphokinase n=1 Tax=Thermohalobaculum xanthum TaxID=2753746 RepID=A0A8J7M9J1_9RHOB|nr:thiamine diphosphokinase [Thermohalobaculum xanthum]MBK0400836.1 thiamine diphosphokinase [Thermohalobaculum xanthum]
MSDLPFRCAGPVTLVGNGPFSAEMLAEAQTIAPDLIAADRGAHRLAVLRKTARAVIGDMDSLPDPAAFDDGRTRVIHLAEQDTTDFEKCLYATEAPFYLGVGFTGGRIDHTLAVFHAMLRYPSKPVVLVGEDEAMALAPAGRLLRLRLRPGARVSIFPLLPVTGGPSRGLAWPLDGLRLAPGERVGTSNEAAHPLVEMKFDAPGALVMVERPFLAALVHAVAAPPPG